MRAFNDTKIKEFLRSKKELNLPCFRSHSQSAERSVLLVSEASHCVYGRDHRHSFIKTKVLSTNLRPVFASKCDYAENYGAILRKDI